MPDPIILSSDSHVFEPADLWSTRIDDAFKARAPRIEGAGEVDHMVIEDGRMFAGIGLISNAGARYEAPETIQDHATFVEPHQYSTGMVHVFVNGEQVLRDGAHTGAKPGRFVKGPGFRP